MGTLRSKKDQMNGVYDAVSDARAAEPKKGGLREVPGSEYGEDEDGDRRKACHWLGRRCGGAINWLYRLPAYRHAD
ncbi:hypothetical protein V7S43_016470 [Phytophthora oleae]|uniref:Uncharacterized protein n=1 Tax=Phytophthora oleae TaxID=2107226 RepID=A0ABD3EZ20_9STRA